MKTIASTLAKLRACGDARKWAESLGHDDYMRAWLQCPSAEWMLWLAGCLRIDVRARVAAACACARVALPKWEERYPDDPRPRNATETMGCWSRGAATIEEAGAAHKAAWDAWRFVYCDYSIADADYAAYYAAHAAYCAAAHCAAAHCAAAAAYAARAFGDDAEAAARCADEVRRIITWPMVADALESLR